MPLSSPDLFDRIKSFQFDGPDTQLTFYKRLARENRWSEDFSTQVIEEYKRFIYLACISDHTVTPSDEVDQAWHLHLTYTRSYWEDFCEQCLGRVLHHDPTEGGQQEDQKYFECYERTLELYRMEFDRHPPQDIWPSAELRFSRAAHLSRVDTSAYWLVSKTLLKKPASLSMLSILMLSLAGCTVFGFKLTQQQVIIAGLIIALLVILIYLLTRVKRKGGGCGSGGCGSGCGGDSGCGGGGCGGGD